MSETVYVGLSGGVDSATSTALLKEQGFNVVGVFIKIWQPEFIECTWREDRLDAMRVAASLSIPFKEIDLSDEYKNTVVEQMISDYTNGRTPNPDVLCNTQIKFGSFMKWAIEDGADYVATGHYSRIRKGTSYELLRGLDDNKDQSYFLHGLQQELLHKILFPVGELRKEDVRSRAKSFGLPVALKHDSQGLCFVGDVSIPEFLSRYIQLSKGPVKNNDGKEIGEHAGAALYTIGQRHGFMVMGKEASTPLYVTRVDKDNNTIYVSTNRDDAARKNAVVTDVHWIGSAPDFPTTCLVQTRYRETPVVATLAQIDSNIVCTFDTPHLVSAGQSLVIYDSNQCLGGGVITDSY